MIETRLTLPILCGLEELISHAGFDRSVLILLILALLGGLAALVRRFHGRSPSPLEGLAGDSARAVTRFNNGRGVVAVLRDGREVQFRARLVEPVVPVKVGDTLRVVDVESSAELLWVSYF